ncbi:MAG: hypothetical protein IJX80_10115 [Clostridia bacterium]|nr:hypothetical protein [Clostridia bacterium]
MCNIAGYVGNKQAAPILIEMLRRQQYYDGGAGTGIATIHNGVLYSTKVVGDVDELLRTTDALNFPGTIGIAHSRPGGDDVEHMHPFLDFSGKLALVANGIFGTTNTPAYMDLTSQIVNSYLARGLRPRSAIVDDGSGMFRLPDNTCYHGTETYALRTGELFDQGMSVCEALGKTLTERPNGIVAVALHADEPDTIAIGKLDRPMSVGLIGEETYIATTQFGFPEDLAFDTVVQPPYGVICAARAGELTITRHRVENMHMELVTAEIFKKAYDLTEAYLRGKKEDPKNLWDLEKMYETEWKHIWQKPYCDCVFQKDTLFKPYAELSYNVLYAMQKEGKLHKVLKLRNGRYPMYHFYLD